MEKTVQDIISEIIEEWFLLEPVLFAVSCTHTFEQNDRITFPMRSGRMKVEYCPQEMKGWSKDRISRRLKAELIRILLMHPYQRQPHNATRGGMMLTSEVTIADSYPGLRNILWIPQELGNLKPGLSFEEYYPFVKQYLDLDRISPPYDREGIFDDGGGGETDDENVIKDNPDPSPGKNSNSVNPSKKVDESRVNNDNTSANNTEKDGRNNNYVEKSEQCFNVDLEGNNEYGTHNEVRVDSLQHLDVCDGKSMEYQSLTGDDSASVKQSHAEEDSRSGCTDAAYIEKLEQMAGLWEEDQLAQEQIREVIDDAIKSRKWGSLSKGIVEKIIASAAVKIDYRRILAMFRASVLSSKRHLTRMKPSRRYGFQFMGSKRDFCTRLLVAIDVSGSVSSGQISRALSVINRFFKYGVENMDVVQFDAALTCEMMSMKKARKEIRITGRGGTDFQEVIDKFAGERYDALIVITDGYADKPELPALCIGRILWILYDEPDTENSWIRNFPRSRYLVLPGH